MLAFCKLRRGQRRSRCMSGAQLTCAEPAGVLDDSSLDLGVQGRHALVVEGYFAAYEDVKDDAEAPHVDLGSRVGFGVEQLGRGKVERPAKGAEVRRRRVEIRQTKVDDLDVARLGDENVFNLEVCGRRAYEGCEPCAPKRVTTLANAPR